MGQGNCNSIGKTICQMSKLPQATEGSGEKGGGESCAYLGSSFGNLVLLEWISRGQWGERIERGGGE